MQTANNKIRRHFLWLCVIGFYLSIVAIWQTVSWTDTIKDYLFPSPIKVVDRLFELAFDDKVLWPGVKATFQRMASGFLIAAIFGLLIGVFMGMNRIVNSCLKSLFLGLQTLPTAAWVPISILLFGLKDSGIYFVIFMSSMPAIAIATSDGILNIPPIYLRVARTFGTPTFAMPIRVILPASLPTVVTGLKLGWTLAWHGCISAELIKSSIGLGYLLHTGRELNDAAQIIGIMILTILIGLLLDQFVFGLIQNKIRRRWGLIQNN